MIFKRDFIFNRDALISYCLNLQEFVGKKCRQTELAKYFKKKYPENKHYNALDRKFATLKFYGFVYFNEAGQLMFNEHFEKYIDCLKNNEEVSNYFLKLLYSSKYKYYKNSETNFFQLLIRLLQDKSILYLDHIDMITYLQHYDVINDFDKLTDLLKMNRTTKFSDKVVMLEAFYRDNNLGNIAVSAHDVKYLFTFLVNNGFYTVKNSLQSKSYLQGETVRTLEDRRLYLSKNLLEYINGFNYESIVDEIEYNSELETGLYDDPDKEVIKLINPSEETQKNIVRRYKTDRKLRNNALKKSGYVCELAKLKGEKHETFSSRMYDGNYVEVHHLTPMHAQEDELFVKEDKLISLDQMSNLVVLCPTCHSKLHYGKNEDVKPELELLFGNRENALHENELMVDKEKLFEFYNI